MCQSIVTNYAFCGCTGATYQQKCPESSSTCELLLARPTAAKLQCYCEEHSSKPFKTRHEDERESKRIDKEYQKIRQREKLHEESARHKREEERRENESEALKYEEFPAMDRKKADEVGKRKAETKAGRRPGIRDRGDGICRIM